MISIGNSVGNGALHAIRRSEKLTNTTIKNIASGSRLSSASTDPSGRAVSNRIGMHANTLKKASENSSAAMSMLGVAHGGLAQIHNMLNRMLSLGIQSRSGTISATDRGFLNTEYQNLLTEINNIATRTTYNGIALINGTYNRNFQVGTRGTDRITMNLISVRANSAGLNLTGTSLSTLANSTTAVTRLNTAVDRIGRYLSTIGGFMSRFEYRKDYIDTTITSLSSAVSSIADSDIGTEEIALTNGTILNKTSMYALTNIYKKQRSAVSLFA